MHWECPGLGADNSSGFTALPGGYRGFYGEFVQMGNIGYWWSTKEAGVTNAWSHDIFHSMDSMYPYSNSGKYLGFSVRCVKD